MAAIGGGMTALARRSVEQAWLRILRELHPDVAWTLRRPRLKRDASTALRQTGGSVPAEDEKHSLRGRAA